MSQVLALVGAFFVLAAFAGLQVGRATIEQRSYQLANLVGAACLATAGLMTQTWGFVVLNVVWAAFAAHRLVTMASSR